MKNHKEAIERVFESLLEMSDEDFKALIKKYEDDDLTKLLMGCVFSSEDEE